MAKLTIELKKKTDGATSLSCRRSDGSVTWQNYKGQQGRFFPLHDLTHYAVETVLDHRQGFFGLVADGWNVTDFGEPSPRGPLPPEAMTTELIVGFLDTERASRERSAAADFNTYMATSHSRHQIDAVCELSDDDLDKIRDVRSKLFARWAALADGDTMSLEFSRDDAPGSSEKA